MTDDSYVANYIAIINSPHRQYAIRFLIFQDTAFGPYCDLLSPTRVHYYVNNACDFILTGKADNNNNTLVYITKEVNILSYVNKLLKTPKRYYIFITINVHMYIVT